MVLFFLLFVMLFFTLKMVLRGAHTRRAPSFNVTPQPRILGKPDESALNQRFGKPCTKSFGKGTSEE